MTDTANLALPCIEAAQAQKHVTHNEALRILDTLVQLAVLDRDLNAPPASPSEGERWLVKASPAPSGAWVGHGHEIAAWQDGGWQFSAPRTGWLAYVVDESVLLAWDGNSWELAVNLFGPALQNITLLGVGTTADGTNPLSAKLNNALFAAKTVAEGGDGNLRYKLSKESAANTLSFLLQDNYSGRAEIGLTGDDDFHFKTSADGSTWVDALIIDKTTGATKINSAFFLSGDISPTQITADQNDYSPAGLAGASVLRLSGDASRNLTGIANGADGRVLVLLNVGSFDIVLKHDTTSTAANRFTLGGSDLRIPAGLGVVLIYDATATRWRVLTEHVGDFVRYDAAQSLTAVQQAQLRSNVSSALKGHIFGLTLSNNSSDPANDIDIAAGEAASTETDPVLMVLSSALTKRLDANWAVGTNQGGLDTGSVSSGIYHVWLIRRSDTGVVDALFSASASSPTMPTNYDQKRRIGAIRFASGAIDPFAQYGDHFQRATSTLDVNATNPGTSAVTATLSVPTGINVRAHLMVQIRNEGTTSITYAWVRGLAAADESPTIGLQMFGPSRNTIATNVYAAGVIEVWTNTSGQIRYRLSLSDADVQVAIRLLGWTDTRGRLN